MTRGVHLGYQRNYFSVQIDDVFLPDSRWSATLHCTPGDDCAENPESTDIRMTPEDVAKLVAWQTTNGFAFDMAFNGGGSDDWKANHAGTDALTDALTATGIENQFTWINHTYSHEFLGCVQRRRPADGSIPTGRMRPTGPESWHDLGVPSRHREPDTAATRTGPQHIT